MKRLLPEPERYHIRNTTAVSLPPPPRGFWRIIGMVISSGERTAIASPSKCESGSIAQCGVVMSLHGTSG